MIAPRCTRDRQQLSRLLAGQLTETGLEKVQIAYDGHVAKMNTRALTSAVVAGLLRPMLADVNFVSAPLSAKERGIMVEEVTRDAAGDYESLITVTVVTERMTRAVSGTVFADGRPRIVNIKGIRVDAEFGPSMLYVTNVDKPGFIGRFASLIGDAQINIATFNLGRDTAGGNAIALIAIDGEVPDELLTRVQALPHVQQAKRLHF
jgi:D-3-phosphoglycerate dehydrogenase